MTSSHEMTNVTHDEVISPGGHNGPSKTSEFVDTCRRFFQNWHFYQRPSRGHPEVAPRPPRGHPGVGVGGLGWPDFWHPSRGVCLGVAHARTLAIFDLKHWTSLEDRVSRIASSRARAHFVQNVTNLTKTVIIFYTSVKDCVSRIVRT